jgi:prepilin-type N-terminal cleavage/methylation domain-containing protein
VRTSSACSEFGRPARSGRAAGAFTLIETMVVMGVIAILAGVVLLAIRHVKSAGDVAAETAMVTTLQKGVEQFKQQFGFLPPLVDDDTPVNGANQIVIWSAADLSSSIAPTSVHGGKRWSEYSLAYYLVGALDKAYDGGDVGFTAPNRDGSFSKHGRLYSALVDVSAQKTRTGGNRLYIENITSSTASMKQRCVIWDRWSDGMPNTSSLPVSLATATSHPIRYYHWLPSYVSSGSSQGQVDYFNVPSDLDPSFQNVSKQMRDSNPTMYRAPKLELRSAEYAIVSPGPDGVFGTADDIMEVGK